MSWHSSICMYEQNEVSKKKNLSNGAKKSIQEKKHAYAVWYGRKEIV